MCKSTWSRAIDTYEAELRAEWAEAVRYADHVGKCTPSLHVSTLLNGAKSWQEYSEGGCALVYDDDLAARLYPPSRAYLARRHGLRDQGTALAVAAARILRSDGAECRRPHRLDDLRGADFVGGYADGYDAPLSFVGVDDDGPPNART
jgi:hypothetical protein